MRPFAFPADGRRFRFGRLFKLFRLFSWLRPVGGGGRKGLGTLGTPTPTPIPTPKVPWLRPVWLSPPDVARPCEAPMRPLALLGGGGTPPPGWTPGPLLALVPPLPPLPPPCPAKLRPPWPVSPCCSCGREDTLGGAPLKDAPDGTPVALRPLLRCACPACSSRSRSDKVIGNVRPPTTGVGNAVSDVGPE